MADNKNRDSTSELSKSVGGLRRSVYEMTRKMEQQTKAHQAVKTGALSDSMVAKNTKALESFNNNVSTMSGSINLDSKKLEKSINKLQAEINKVEGVSAKMKDSTEALITSNETLGESMGELTTATNKQNEKLDYFGEGLKTALKWTAIAAVPALGAAGMRLAKGYARSAGRVGSAPIRAGLAVAKRYDFMQSEAAGHVVGDVRGEIGGTMKKGLGSAALWSIGGPFGMVMQGLLGSKSGGSGSIGERKEGVMGAMWGVTKSVTELKGPMENMGHFFKNVPEKARKEGFLHIAPTKEFADEKGDGFKISPSITYEKSMHKSISAGMSESMNNKEGVFGKMGSFFSGILSPLFALAPTVGFMLPIWGAGFRAEANRFINEKRQGMFGAMVSGIKMLYVSSRFAAEESNEQLYQIATLLKAGFGLDGRLIKPQARSLSEFIGKAVGSKILEQMGYGRNAGFTKANAKPLRSFAKAAYDPHMVTQSGPANVHQGEMIGKPQGIFGKAMGGLGSLFGGFKIFKKLKEFLNEGLELFRPLKDLVWQLKTIFGTHRQTGKGKIKSFTSMMSELPNLLSKELGLIGQNVSDAVTRSLIGTENAGKSIMDVIAYGYQKMIPTVVKSVMIGGDVYGEKTEGIIPLMKRSFVGFTKGIGTFVTAIADFGDIMKKFVTGDRKGLMGELKNVGSNLFEGLMTVLNEYYEITLSGLISIKKAFSAVRKNIAEQILPQNFFAVYSGAEDIYTKSVTVSAESSLASIKAFDTMGASYKKGRGTGKGMFKTPAGIAKGVAGAIWHLLTQTFSPFKELVVQMKDSLIDLAKGMVTYGKGHYEATKEGTRIWKENKDNISFLGTIGGFFKNLVGDIAETGMGTVRAGKKTGASLQEAMKFAGAPGMASGGVITGEEVPIRAHSGEIIGEPTKVIGWLASALEKIGVKKKDDSIYFKENFETAVVKRLDAILEVLQKGTSNIVKAGKGPGFFGRMVNGITTTAWEITKMPLKLGNALMKPLAEAIKLPFKALNASIKHLTGIAASGFKTISSGINAGFTALKVSIDAGWQGIKLGIKGMWEVIKAPFRWIAKPFQKLGELKDKAKAKIKGFIRKVKGEEVIAVDSEGKAVYAKWPSKIIQLLTLMQKDQRELGIKTFGIHKSYYMSQDPFTSPVQGFKLKLKNYTGDGGAKSGIAWMVNVMKDVLGKTLGGITTVLGSIAGTMGITKAAKAAKGLAAKGASKIKGVASATKGLAAKGAAKASSTIAGKALLKSGLKKIPVLGALAGLGFGLSRLMKGDVAGAIGEVASGAASIIPGVGTAASVGIDTALAARDIKKKKTGTISEDKLGISKWSGSAGIKALYNEANTVMKNPIIKITDDSLQVADASAIAAMETRQSMINNKVIGNQMVAANAGIASSIDNMNGANVMMMSNMTANNQSTNNVASGGGGGASTEPFDPAIGRMSQGRMNDI
ncbi:MAG: hypothetical protein KAS32_02325 [Candidatus Peribacteraceae bacterium]|nr:hypothetical protein [Candidatus Peribacteraceae bacterium]